ncbi:4-amino-4-deoxy-L-arabinose-phosphoundecaprenol flippase subunit ArnE [Shimwellia pseudoproteus]|uniref:4-amino-4-deoxy-L-arabinose-phosphoundecaprenol flippase subunit ArnE n=1 Tax=Shimwellia pseudoproteus TaxID=570012 RepID=UPI0018EDE4BB|nr:4-amino-4-deoxy-L-arabinose-phosphoundecaprenol flippase subunit ArnE [Shimwellia pseudoproteus]MBJ3816935.1 4-amino-4-deoxy-L-arabinose-phosphoundecaprenol flippase subunit ArnE [Shimwellia pseudoproteus]
MTGWLLLAAASLLSCMGQLCQKQAALIPADARARRRVVILWLALALALLGAGMLLWLGVLQRLPVGVAYPLLSLNIVWITLAARLLWHEPVSLRHWLGIGLIIAGVILVGRSV